MRIRRKPRPEEQRNYLAHSLYAAVLGSPDPGHYRSTTPGAPDVAALVHPGMVIRTSYGTSGTVIGVEGPYVHLASDGREHPHFTIVYVPSERFCRQGKLDHNWINECVAVDGRILKLLEVNLNEVFIEGAVSGWR
ncbi:MULTISPECIES: hypothetical protein [Agrobacterium]|jgi:hypothetical protein|uniref:hypothetical protein n=1 Tax=Agrobacterium TaxID=357 RepID=UPI001C6E985F|nr:MULTISPECIES: hypothetical protein [Agrobacterium]MBW9075050.1 hypothetical protein [Agrobacterium deltaense]MCZ7889574.1 hypothetical protein [Agrobacterium salinitolerans]UNZ54114.1 hypothetical protein MLE07_24845 [Agrobacterium tumefaciens]